MSAAAGRVFLTTAAAILGGAALASMAASKIAAAHAASEERKRGVLVRAELAAAAREQRARAAAAEAAAARRSGTAPPPPDDAGGGVQRVISFTAREALGGLAAALDRHQLLHHLLAIPVLGGKETAFVVLCAALVLGDAVTVYELAWEHFGAGGRGAAQGYALPAGALGVGLSVARLSSGAAGEVVGFLERLVGWHAPLAPAQRSAALLRLLDLRKGLRRGRG